MKTEYTACSVFMKYQVIEKTYAMANFKFITKKKFTNKRLVPFSTYKTLSHWYT